jgi:hypothetical protein
MRYIEYAFSRYELLGWLDRREALLNRLIHNTKNNLIALLDRLPAGRY